MADAAQRTRQLFYQARLLLDAAHQPHDPLVEVAWQETCYEAALGALLKIELSFLRELAEAYRLQPQRVQTPIDLQQQAQQRDQRLYELEVWQEDRLGIGSRLKMMAAQLGQPRSEEAALVVPAGQIAVQREELSPLEELERLYQQLKAQVDMLRSGLLEE